MSRDIIQLAFAQLTVADALVVQLLHLEDMPAAEQTLKPAAVRILWPLQPTVVGTGQFPDLAAVAVKTLAGAAVELSRLKAQKRPL